MAYAELETTRQFHLAGVLPTQEKGLSLHFHHHISDYGPQRKAWMTPTSKGKEKDSLQRILLL